MNIVATEAGNPAPVHNALNEVVPLHAVLMRSPIRKMREGRLAQLVLLELPKIL
jgi:hypothetical protein